MTNKSLTVREYDNIPLKPTQRILRLSTLTDVANAVRESRQDRPQVFYYQADRPRLLSTPAVDTWYAPTSLSRVEPVRRTLSSSDYTVTTQPQLVQQPALPDLNPMPSPLPDPSPLSNSQYDPLLHQSPPLTPISQAENLLEEE